MTKPCIVLNPNLRVEYAARLLTHQNLKPLEQTASEEYWDDYPEAFKDREYHEWCSG